MHRFGTIRDTATAVVLCTALLWLGLAGCAEDSRPPDWDGPDGGDHLAEDGPILPGAAPADSMCTGGWCWIHPRPFPYPVSELGAVGGEVYGLVGVDSYEAPAPFVWGDGFDVQRFPSEVLDSGSLVDTAVGTNGWLALTSDGVVYEFNENGVIAEFELPDGDYDALEGHSAAMFMVTSVDSGGYIRRAGNLQQDEALGRKLKWTKMWPNGDVWQASERRPQQPPAPANRRWFPVPDAATAPLTPTPHSTLAPDPESACAGKGIWGAFGSGVLHRWDQQDEAWKAVDLPDQAEISDLTCREDGTLFATSTRGKLFARQHGTWNAVANTGRSRLLAATSRGNTLYAAGEKGAMYEFSDSGLERRGGGLLPESLQPANSGFSELWVNTEGTEAIFMGGAGVYRLTAEGARDVTPPQEPPNTEFGDALRNEVWGLEDPEFAITESRVLRWTATGWEESSLTNGRDGHFRPVDIDGTARDNVWVATNNELFRFDGNAWQSVSSPEDDITQISIDSRSSGLVALGDELHEVKKEGGAWRLELFKETPCKELGAIHRTPDGELWVAGTEMCVARSTKGGWQVFEPLFEFERFAPLDLLPWTFVDHPDYDRPLIASTAGVLIPTDDSELRRLLSLGVVDAHYVADPGVLVAETGSAVIARWDE